MSAIGIEQPRVIAMMVFTLHALTNQRKKNIVHKTLKQKCSERKKNVEYCNTVISFVRMSVLVFTPRGRKMEIKDKLRIGMDCS